jgi:hypothetical protein
MKPKHFGDSFRGRRKFQREFQRTRKPMSEQDLALEIAKQMTEKPKELPVLSLSRFLFQDIIKDGQLIDKDGKTFQVRLV